MQVCLSDHGIEIFKYLSYGFLATFSVQVVLSMIVQILIFESVSMINQIVESSRLKKTSGITESSCLLSTAKSTIFLCATSTHLINAFRSDGTTTMLYSLCQMLTNLSVDKFFAISDLNCSWDTLRPHPVI